MKPSGNIKYTHDFKPFSVELLPAISTESRIKYTGQERDNFTNFDYMHFRFYASSIGRFLTLDNIIPDITNPQNWNGYSYVKGNPINFNDPVGHTGQGMAKPYYFVNGGSASWLNCDTYCAFMSGLYGGNVTFGAGGVYGGGGTQSTGYWKPIYGTIVTTSGEPVWNEELQAWVGLEVKVIWEVAGYQYVEIKSGGEGRASAYQTELDRIDKIYNLWIKLNTGRFSDFYHFGGPLSSLAWIFSGGAGGSCVQLAQEAASFINEMNSGGNLIAEDVQSFIYIPGTSIPISAHSTIEIKLEGKTIRTYDPYWRLFWENCFSRY